MRFWPFGKRQRAETDEARPTALASPVAAAAPVPRPASGAWRHLPPLQPTAASLDLTAPVQRLADTITSTQHPQVAASRLGHARTIGGPTGTVAGLVRQHRVVHSDGAGVPLTFAHAPEPVEAALAVPIRPWASAQRLPAATESASPVSSSTMGAPAAPDDPSGAVSDTARRPSPLPSLPARAMAVRVAAAASARAPVASPAPTATPAVQRLAAPSPSEPDTTASTSSSGGIERSLVDAPAPSRPDAPTLGNTRIVRRIGAPMHTRPPSMVDAVPASTGAAATQEVQRLPVAIGAPGADPIATTPAPAAIRSVPGELPPKAARSMPVRTATAQSMRERSFPASPASGVAGRPASVRPVAAAGDAPIAGRAPSIQRLPGSAPSLTIPTLSSPDEPSGGPTAVPVRRGVQRAPESVPPAVRSELEPVLGDSLADVKIHRGPETGEAARSIQAKAFTTGGAVYLPDEVGSTASGEGRQILAHELTHVVQQRSLGGSLPGEDSADGARLESEARIIGGQDPVPTRPVRPTARPAAAGPAQRLAGSPMPNVARPLTPMSGAAPGASGGSPMPPSSQAAIVATVQAAASRAGVPSAPPAAPPFVPSAGASVPASTSSAGFAPAVQRLPGDTASAATESTQQAGPPASTLTSNGSAAAHVTEATPEADIDDLARQLYPRFRTRLKSDLLADRERSGRLFDR